MNVTQAVEERIQQGIRDIFTLKEYPKFLVFAGNFTSFSYKNVIMLYMQAPDAQYVAGLVAWKQITDEQVSPDAVPILVLYPEYDEKKKSFEYTIRKVFDFKQLGKLGDNGTRLKQLTRKCSAGSVYGYFKKHFKEATGLSVYPAEDNIKTIEVNGNTALVPAQADDKEKFRMLLDSYLLQEQKEADTKLVSGCISNTVRYIVYSYYGFAQADRIAFPYISQPILDDAAKAYILQRSFELAGRIIGSVDASYLEHIKARKKEQER